MAHFIRLNEANKDNSKVLLNVEHIGSIQSGNRQDVYVRMAYNSQDKEGKFKTEYYFIKETFEEIERMIGASISYKRAV